MNPRRNFAESDYRAAEQNRSVQDSIDPEKAEVTYLLSPGTVDRHRTIFLPSCWPKRLPVFEANPVFIWNHSMFGGQPADVLGKVIRLWTDDSGLWARVKYAVDENPQARFIFDMVRGGFINAVSHRFRPHAWVERGDREELINTLPHYAQRALRSGEAWAVFTDCELTEASQVMVGSNREAQAVRRAIADGICPLSEGARLLGELSLVESLFAPAAHMQSTSSREVATMNIDTIETRAMQQIDALLKSGMVEARVQRRLDEALGPILERLVMLGQHFHNINYRRPTAPPPPPPRPPRSRFWAPPLTGRAWVSTSDRDRSVCCLPLGPQVPMPAPTRDPGLSQEDRFAMQCFLARSPDRTKDSADPFPSFTVTPAGRELLQTRAAERA